MPKAGFKSITVTDFVYENFFKIYKANKEELKMKGVSSFSGYITYLIEEIMENEQIFEKYKPRFEKISLEFNERVVIKDNEINRIVEIFIQKGELFCYLCDSNKCSHIGFCYSLHQIYPEISL